MKKALIVFSLLMPLFLHLAGQGWKREYPDTVDSNSRSFIQTQDGGFLCVNFNSILKTDVDGNLLWRKKYPKVQFNSTQGNAIQNTDGSYYVIGTHVDSMLLTCLMKLDPWGNEIWRRNYGWKNTVEPLVRQGPRSIIRLSDGNLLITGSDRDTTWTDRGMYVLKADTLGNVIWEERFIGIYGNSGFNVAETDSEFVFLTHTRNPTSKCSNFIMRTDKAGNWKWNTIFALGYTAFFTGGFDQTVDAGFVFAARAVPYVGSGVEYIYEYAPSPRLATAFKVNAFSDSLWKLTYSPPGASSPVMADFETFIETDDHGYVGLGSVNGPDGRHPFLVKFDSLKNVVGEVTFPFLKDTAYTIDYYYNLSLIELPNGFMIYGDEYNAMTGFTQPFLLKLDSIGHYYNNKLNGTVFSDLTSDCTLDTTDTPLGSWVVKLTNTATGDEQHFFTGADGRYTLWADSGSYRVSAHMPYTDLWVDPICSDTLGLPVTFTGHYQSDTVDIPKVASEYCASLWIDLSTWRVRRCTTSTYTVNYCNFGSDTARAAYATIDMDPWLTLVSASAPYTGPVGSVYTFPLGDIAPGDCGSFTFVGLVSCDTAMPFGITHCVEAHIYPDSTCPGPSPTWDKSSIRVEGGCVGDSLACFDIINVGEDMDAPSEYRIYVDDTLVFVGTFMLAAGDTATICWPAGGHSIRLEADQRPGHPGHSRPRETVEACDSLAGGGFVSGLHSTTPHDDVDRFVSIDCDVQLAPFDPNAKENKPTGVYEQHYITRDDEMEYTLHFQNTGTDTAYFISIRDTLSPLLDLTTLQPGTSSHPYWLELREGRTAVWHFDNIMLPDSFVNEEASHGYAKFRIRQTPGNPDGSVITNKVDIYFEFNPPVTTNEVFNTIGTGFVVIDLVVNEENGAPQLSIDVFPNPVAGQGSIRLSDASIHALTVDWVDMAGRTLRTEHLHGNGTFGFSTEAMAPGIYLLRIHSAEGVLGTAKVMITE